MSVSLNGLVTTAACAALAAALIQSAPATAGRVPARSVAIFYYAWYGTPERDGAWQHWGQNGKSPPSQLGTTYYPARGPYSSSDPALVRAQMEEIAAVGVDTVVVSWWGHGSPEDDRLPLVAAEARRARLALAVHVEPYNGRTPATVAADAERLRARFGVRDFYVYDSTFSDDDDWARSLRTIDGVRMFANTALVGKARAGGFQGLYTYDVLIHSGRSFRRICSQARAAGLLCAPSVGPGFDGRRATAITAVRDRRNGSAYDASWTAAVAAAPDVVTLTSYNEWHEGTQIEPARAVGGGYASYEGAYGLTGEAAETAYLERTRQWIERLRGGAPPGRVLPGAQVLSVRR